MNYIPAHNKNAIKDLLRSFIGRHAFPVEVVADRSGLSVRNIYSHLSADGSLPNAEHLLGYFRALGPLFTNHYLAMAGQGGALEVTPVEVCPNAHLIETADFTLLQTRFMKDQLVDHSERPLLRAKAHERVIGNLRLVAAIDHGLLRSAA